MSKRIFSEEEIKILLQNEHVDKCSPKSISYSKEFKMLAVKRYHEGLPPNEIFRQMKFDIDLIGRETPERCLHRWLKTFRQKGEAELKTETRGRGKGGGRPKQNWTNDKERIKYMEAQIAYLKAENDFLAKLRKKS